MKITAVFAAMLIVAGVSPAVWAASHSATTQSPDMPAHQGMEAQPAAAGGDPEHTQAFQQAQDKMMQEMPVLTGSPNRDFALQMIPHHQAAIDMARIELQHGTDPQLKKMAQEIIGAQQKEIATLRDWLAKNPR